MHKVVISDPFTWQAHDGSNKILAEGLGVVHGSPCFQVPERMYLLRLVHSVVVDGEGVSQLLISPRYVGDTLEQAMSSYCIVGISRVKPNVTLQAGDDLDGSESVYWAVGSTTRQ